MNTRKLPDWHSPAFNDAEWAESIPVDRGLGVFRPPSIDPISEVKIAPSLLAEGLLVELFGYKQDNPSARFFLRALQNGDLPPQGVWRRYDMGRVRLMRPQFRIELPAGAVVEFAYAEQLLAGRVVPWITLSDGDSCNFDHYIARGGAQEFSPCNPRGGRFLEIHILAPPAQIHFLDEQIMDRGYHGSAQGAFRSGDALLDQIWSVGVETYRACAEDALTDNPTRERGQWTGDVVSVGMDIAACVFGDLRLLRRGLVQCAQCAREDGLIAGLCPGQSVYLPTYSAQWITACVHYWRLTGDLTLLMEMFDHAERNIASFEAKNSLEGIRDELGLGFIDWGYVRNTGPSDMGLNLHYLAGLHDMVIWSNALRRPDRASHFGLLAEKLRSIVAQYFDNIFLTGADAWSRIGYHRSVLGLRLDFFEKAQEPTCLEAIKAHMMSCFPNDPHAPRLSDPSVSNQRLITPYFAHYAMPLLIERGEMDFLLEQYRRCWGWALGDGRTTWLEVFDTRWSHCHQWSGGPTWQLSRYGLGLHSRYDLGAYHYDFLLVPGSMTQASGKIPVPDSMEAIEVTWEKASGEIRYHVQTPVPLVLHFANGCVQNVESTTMLELNSDGALK